MFEPPELSDDLLAASLRDAWGVRVVDLTFLPLGADINTAVYRAVADDGTPWFAKLRRSAFDGTTVRILQHLREHGIEQIIAPDSTRAGALWTHVGDFAVTLYPFVTGQNAVERSLSDDHWHILGAALRQLHAMKLPPELAAQLPQEAFSSSFRERVQEFQDRAERDTFDDPVASHLATLLRANCDPIDRLLARADELAALLRSRAPERVLCHADLHAYNVLIDERDRLYIVDWDTLALAPKERDLATITAGIGGVWDTGREAALFYAAYAETQIDPHAFAYYRYERIIEDIAAFCDELLTTDAGGDDREQSLRYVASNFGPDGAIERAFLTE